MVQIAGPCLFLAVASVSSGSKAAIEFFIAAHFLRPFWSSGTPVCKLLVSVRARIADVLVAVGLGKEQPQADAACGFGVGRVEAFRSRNGGTQIDNVLERRIRVLRVAGGACISSKSLRYSSSSVSLSALKYAEGIPYLLGPPTFWTEARR